MKKIILITIILGYTINGFSQLTPEFEFTLYAEDFLGNRDSIIIGYDSTATEHDGIDTQFGEVDITNIPFDSIFEMRASVNNFPSGEHPHEYYQTKKEIAKWQCFNKHPFLDGTLHLSIRSVNLPIRLSWDRSLFQDSCNNWFAMSEDRTWEIGGYNGNTSHAILKDSDTYIAFNNGGGPFYDVFLYTAAIEDGTVDTIYGLTMYIWTRNKVNALNISTSRVNQDLTAKIFPNPVTNQLNIEIPEAFREARTLRLFNANGQLVRSELVTQYLTTTEVGTLSNGLYFYTIENRKGELIRGKFLKVE